MRPWLSDDSGERLPRIEDGSEVRARDQLFGMAVSLEKFPKPGVLDPQKACAQRNQVWIIRLPVNDTIVIKLSHSDLDWAGTAQHQGARRRDRHAAAPVSLLGAERQDALFAQTAEAFGLREALRAERHLVQLSV